MKDRIPGAPGRYSAVVTGQELQKLQTGKPFAITLNRDDQPIVEGTPYSKAAVLPDDVAEQLCPGLDDPTPGDAFRGLSGVKTELGNSREIFGLNLLSHENAKYFKYGYLLGVGEKCHAYTFAVPATLSGKTIKVKTYMYGDMECVFNAPGRGSISETIMLNSTANVAEKPESGIAEFEAVVPYDYEDIEYCVSFYENPYMAMPEVCEACGTVWEEIRLLKNSLASGGAIVAEYDGSVTVAEEASE